MKTKLIAYLSDNLRELKHDLQVVVDHNIWVEQPEREKLKQDIAELQALIKYVKS